jgi:hypothetical protein
LLHTRRKVEGLEDEQDTIKDPSVYWKHFLMRLPLLFSASRTKDR